MTVPIEERADIRERRIHASPEALFAAFSDPVRLARWWGPEGFTNTFEVFDFKPAGDWRFTMHGPDGKDYWNESTFSEIVLNERIVIEHGSTHHFFLTLTYKADGEDTIVGWQQLFDSKEHYLELADFVAQANEQNLDRMEAEVMRATDKAC